MSIILPPGLSMPGPLCDDTDFLMFDNFPGEYSKVNGPPAKKPIIGSGTWAVTAASQDITYSGNGNLNLKDVSSGNAYAQIALGEIPGEIGCTFEHVGPFPEDDVTPTLALFPAFDTATQNNFHFQAALHILSWTYWKDSAGPQVPAWQTANTYALSPNSFYTYRVFIDPPYAFGFLFDSAGTLIGHITVNEPNMSNVIGEWMFVQLFSKELNYRSVWARRKRASSLVEASMLRGAAVHIGGGTPSGVLSARYDASFSSASVPTIAASKGDAEFRIVSELAGTARLVLSSGREPYKTTGASIADAGAGYQKDDLLTVQGGTLYPGPDGAPAQLRVNSVGPEGAITAISVAAPGLYQAPPANHVAVDTGIATFDLTNAGSTPIAFKIDVSGIFQTIVFEDINNVPWLTKPPYVSREGVPSGYPYVPGGIRVGGVGGPFWLSGAGAPNGQVEAPVGSLYSRTDGGAGTTLYVKETGSDNTGWIPK
jgi:hypothetical protein